MHVFRISAAPVLVIMAVFSLEPVTADPHLFPVPATEVSVNCVNCIDCSDGESHYDQTEVLGKGDVTGGTYVNLCRVAYSQCPGLHDPCTPDETLDDEDELSVQNLSALENVVARGTRNDIQQVAQGTNGLG